MMFTVIATKFCSIHFLFGRVCLFPSPLTHKEFEYTIFLAHTEFVNEYKAYTSIFFWQYDHIKIKSHEVVYVCVCSNEKENWAQG